MARRPGQQVGLQTTVMVDVLFILLIFFIIVSRVRDSNLQIDLPAVEKKQQEGATTGPTGLVLSIDRGGRVYLDGRESGGVDGLRRQLESHKSTAARTPVMLRADKQAPSGVTVQVVHLLADLGFARVQFDVLAADKEGR